MWVLGVWRYLGQVQHSTSSAQTLLAWFIPFSPIPRLWPFSPSLQQRHCTNTPTPLTMDPPQTSSSANDIFSLSDQVLAERLQFIEEVQTVFSQSSPTAPLTCAFSFCIDWIWKLGKCMEMLPKTRPFVEISTQQV